MNYEKPNATLIASAFETIKGQLKEPPLVLDSQFLESTPSAYQADE